MSEVKNNKLKLTNINLKGYKSINDKGQDIPIGDITVLLGANGSGKSNLISFFKMLNHLMTGDLQRYVGDSGFADSLLYYGSKETSSLVTDITFVNSDAKDNYSFSLSHAAGDTLIFTDETLVCQKQNSEESHLIQLDSGLKESGLHNYCREKNNETAQTIFNLLKGCQVFQFNDTSKQAKIKNRGYINDDSFLRSDGGNLAAFLFSMKQQTEGEKYYKRIVHYIQRVMPQFKDFVLNPSSVNENYIFLNWKDNDSDYLFGPHQISDGSLRFMALATLLLQSPKTLPKVIVLDEPELGLHPSAISILAGMVKTASQHSQILLATQSTRLVDEFDTNDIVVVERNEKEKCSTYKKLDNRES